MKLPNGDRAVVEDAKLLDYLLSDTHPRGKHKARVFAAATGITANEAAILKAALLAAAIEATHPRRGETLLENCTRSGIRALAPLGPRTY